MIPLKDIQTAAMLIGVVALISIAALGLEWLTAGWLPGWLTILLLIASPLLAEIVLSIFGKSSQVIGFFLFPSVGFGVPALLLYGVLKVVSWPWSA